MDVDPAASLRIWAVEFELGGRTFEVPALPAADWLPLLLEGDPLAVLDLGDLGEIDEMILGGEVTSEELGKALTMVIEQATGRSFHAALVLAQVAKMQWPIIGGDLVRRGMRFDQVSIGAALDAIHATILGLLKPEAAEKFQALLDSEVSPGGKIRPNRAKAMADFEEMAGPKPPPVKATSGLSGGGRPRTRPRPRPLRQAAR